MEEVKVESEALKGLNPEQKSAVLATTGPVLIVAGAGAGKTKTITHRILHLIKEGVAPSQILAITFTNKAAKEMRERITHLLSENRSLNFPVAATETPFVSTFHSLGVYLLKENCQILGLPRHFSIFDKSDSLRLIKEILKELDIDSKQFEPSKILNLISREKSDLTTVENFSGNATKNGYSLAGVAAKVWRLYEDKKRAEKALDFDDLLLQSYLLLKKYPEILARYQKRWLYLHVDEYQDTNKVQYMMSKLLAEKNRNICVVGDIDQNIYSWRGADIGNLLNFEKDYPEAKIIKLEQNYRSTQTIIAAANEVIKKNKMRLEKNLFTKKEEGKKITVFEAGNEVEEARYIAREAKRLQAEDKVKLSEIALLYRANFQSRVIEEAMIAESVPYQLLGTKFFERKEVKDILSFLRAALNPDSLTDLKRIINVPARGLGKVTILKVFSGQRDDLPPLVKQKVDSFFSFLAEIKTKIEKEKPTEVIKYIITGSGLEKELIDGTDEDKEDLENMKELATLAHKYNHLPLGEGIEKLLEEASLQSDQDELKETEEAVKLMTVHSAKGLEFDYVFITGLEEDLFPHQKLGAQRIGQAEEEEERRLFYVALTRAREKLYLSYAEIRTIFGSQIFNSRSRFFEDIDENLLEKEEQFEFREKIIYLDI